MKIRNDNVRLKRWGFARSWKGNNIQKERWLINCLSKGNKPLALEEMANCRLVDSILEILKYNLDLKKVYEEKSN